MKREAMHNYETDAAKQMTDLERQLYTLPEVAAAAEAEWPPMVWLCCPRGHRIEPVQLHADHNWRLSLVSATEEPTGRAEGAAPWSPAEGVADVRTRLVCAACAGEGHRYEGTKRQTTLLRHYALALRMGWDEIRLQD